MVDLHWVKLKQIKCLPNERILYYQVIYLCCAGAAAVLNMCMMEHQIDNRNVNERSFKDECSLNLCTGGRCEDIKEGWCLCNSYFKRTIHAVTGMTACNIHHFSVCQSHCFLSWAPAEWEELYYNKMKMKMHFVWLFVHFSFISTRIFLFFCWKYHRIEFSFWI